MMTSQAAKPLRLSSFRSGEEEPIRGYSLVLKIKKH